MISGFFVWSLLLLPAWPFPQLPADNPRGPISGVVRYPDGRPAAGATVEAVASCSDHFRLVQTAPTAEDGSFVIPPFREHCSPVQLSASKRSELWLKTGNDVFYGAPNGTSPVVEIPATGSPAPVTILLENRGALITFKVWDNATKRFVYARIHVERAPVKGKRFGSLMTATGKDGAQHTLFLPPGDYEVVLLAFACDGNNYFTNRLVDNWELRTGQTVERTIVIDVREINTRTSYDNPKGRLCGLEVEPPDTQQKP